MRKRYNCHRTAMYWIDLPGKNKYTQQQQQRNSEWRTLFHTHQRTEKKTEQYNHLLFFIHFESTTSIFRTKRIQIYFLLKRSFFSSFFFNEKGTFEASVLCDELTMKNVQSPAKFRFIDFSAFANKFVGEFFFSFFYFFKTFYVNVKWKKIPSNWSLVYIGTNSLSKMFIEIGLSPQ